MKPIREVVPGVIRQAKQRHQEIDRLQRRWARLVGTRLAAHTRPVSLRKRTLYVQTDAPGAHFALSLEKPRLLKRLKAEAGGQIEEIVVRPGEVNPASTDNRK